jgi:hypothetical protein
MRLYGALSELASLVIRLASGKTVTVKSAEQHQQDIEVTIPNVGGAVTKEFLMVEATPAQPITGKTIDFAVNTVTPASLQISKLTAQGSQANQVVKLDAGNLVVSGFLDNSSIANGAAITDNKLAKITTANKVDSGAVQAVQGVSGRVLSFDANGAPSAALIVNDNVAANAGILGSKISDLPASSLAQMSSADLAGRITDETGSGALVFANNPTIGSMTAASGVLSIAGTGALKVPAGLGSERPGSPVEGMIRYNSESDSFEGYASNAWSGIGGGGTVDRINKVGHAFVVGDVLYLNGAVYEKARADAANTAEVVGMVSRVIDVDNFEMTLSGEVGGLTGLVAGEVYFLSAATAGLLTVTEPSVVGQVSLPVGVASSTTSLYVAPKRGVVVGGANLRTQIGLNGAALVSQTTNIQNVTAYTAGELSGWVFIDATTDRRFYIQVQFVKDAANAWKVAYQTTGDTPPAGFNVDVIISGPDAFVQVQMPPVAGWVSGNVNFALNVPAVGATLPLQIDSANVSFTNIQAASSAGIAFKEDGGTTTMTISDAGNVGIGTVSPSSYGHGGTNKFIQVQNSDTSANSQGHYIINSGWNSAGVSGMGTLSWALPNVTAAEKLSAYIGATTEGTHTLAVPNVALTFATRNTSGMAQERARITSDGVLLVGTGTTLPGVGSGPKLQVNDTIAALGVRCRTGVSGAFSGSSFLINWTGSAQLWIDSTNVGNITLTSDYRIKKNIETQELPALERIAQLRPVKYELADYKELFKADGVQREGFIAHELQAVIPSAVEGEKDAEDQIQSLKLDALCSVMVKAIQEQQAQIEEMKAKLAALEAK